MRLKSNRDQDRVHLRDMIDVGLVDREMLLGLPPELASRLDALLNEAVLEILPTVASTPHLLHRKEKYHRP